MRRPDTMSDALGDIERDSFRVPYAAMLLVVRSDDAWVCECQDLSQGGCGIFPPDECTLQEADVVRLYFYERTGRAVPVDARVARVGASNIGFEYHEPQAIPPQRAATPESGV